MKSSTNKTLRTLYATLSLGMFSVLIPSVFTATAHADVYHSVEPGESLATVAKRYNTSPNTLRQANQLGNLGENSTLPAMLLRVPTGDAPVKQAAPRAKGSTPSASAGRYFGTITKHIPYVVRAGDTVESLAASFSREGQSVSAADIRRANKIDDQLEVGKNIRIPITTTYSAAAQLNPAAPAPRQLETISDRGDIGVSISEESDLPYARAITASSKPLYQTAKAPVAQGQPKTITPNRGNLSSRGGYASSNLDGAQILQNGEELLTTPSPRVRTTPVANSNLAKVAKISKGDARIRRLPDAGAVTLYKCSTGTEIAVLKQQGTWSAILMSDRSTGWIPTHYLKMTGVSVDITSQVETTSRAGGDDTANNWKSGYSSNHPAVKHALTYLGTRYVYGGESRRGIDCSSLVQHSFRSAGVRLPRTAATQAKVGKPVAPENLQPGDRLYFSASGRRIDHTGIYMGNGLFVHASGSARKVTVSKLSDRRNWNIFVSARR